MISNWCLNFQVLARFMVMLNFVVPIVSILFIQTGYSSSLNICLGEGYLNFFSTQAQLCTQESSCLCWIWTTILAIGNSKFQINTCLIFSTKLAKNIYLLWFLIKWNVNALIVFVPWIRLESNLNSAIKYHYIVIYLSQFWILWRIWWYDRMTNFVYLELFSYVKHRWRLLRLLLCSRN